MSFEVDMIPALPNMEPGHWHYTELCSGLSSPSSGVQRSEYSFDSLATPHTSVEFQSLDLRSPFLSSLETQGQSLRNPVKDQVEDQPNAKRTKVEWTRELHMVFAGVVRSLPVDQQVPTKILEGMGHWGWGLTRANIASHLQKFRNREREDPLGANHACTNSADAEDWCSYEHMGSAKGSHLTPTTPQGIIPSLAFQSDSSMEMDLGQCDSCPPSFFHQLAQCVQERPVALPIGLALDHGAVLRALRRKGSFGF